MASLKTMSPAWSSSRASWASRMGARFPLVDPASPARSLAAWRMHSASSRTLGR